MVKNEVISAIAAKVEGMTKKDAGVILDVIGEVITEALVAGEEITIPGVGKFTVTEVAERTGTIQLGDKKGETYTTPAHKKPVFKAASVLKDAVK